MTLDLRSGAAETGPDEAPSDRSPRTRLIGHALGWSAVCILTFWFPLICFACIFIGAQTHNDTVFKFGVAIPRQMRLFFGWPADDFTDDGAWRTVVTFLPLVGGFGYYFSTASRRSRAAWQKIASPDVSDSVGDEIVYLRPFKLDAVTGLPSLLFSDDEQIGAAMKRFGSPVALGRDEQMPVGFRRLTSTDANWKEDVSNLLARARLVVIAGAGMTDSFRWEVETVVKTVHPEKICLLVPNKESEWREFLEGVKGLLPDRMPTFLFHISMLSSFRAVIWFDRNWLMDKAPIAGLPTLNPVNSVERLMAAALRSRLGRENERLPISGPISMIYKNIGELSIAAMVLWYLFG